MAASRARSAKEGGGAGAAELRALRAEWLEGLEPTDFLRRSAEHADRSVATLQALFA